MRHATEPGPEKGPEKGPKAEAEGNSGGWGAGDDLAYSNRVPCDCSDVERRDAETLNGDQVRMLVVLVLVVLVLVLTVLLLTRDQFEREFLLANRPLLVRGAAAEVLEPAARSAWTRRGFFARVGAGAVFAPQKLPLWKSELLRGGKEAERSTPLAAYYAQLERGEHPIDGGGSGGGTSGGSGANRTRSGGRLCWNGPHDGRLWAAMEAELRWPRCMRAPTLLPRQSSGGGTGGSAGEGQDESEAAADNGFFGLFMGPQGSGITMHYHKHNWNALLHGRKL